MCPQPCNMKFGANNGNQLRQDTTVLQRLKFLLSEMCSLESKNVVTVTFWVKLTMPALLLKKAIFFCCFFFLCFVLHTLLEFEYEISTTQYNDYNWLFVFIYLYPTYFTKNFEIVYILVFYYYVTYQHKIFILQRAGIYYLAVSIGQESGHGLAGSSALDSQATFRHWPKLVPIMGTIPFLMVYGYGLHVLASCWLRTFSALRGCSSSQAVHKLAQLSACFLCRCQRNSLLLESFIPTRITSLLIISKLTDSRP